MEIIRPLIILIAFCYLLFSIAYILHRILNTGRRLAFLQAFVVIGGLVWFITELLSIFRAITFTSLACSWGIICLVVMAIVVKVADGNIRGAVLNEIRNFQKHLLSLPRDLFVVLVITFVSLTILGIIAFIAAPNTWDSMTYHLSRVMHWEQNQSIAFYPTSIERQLHLGPFAEIAILNFQILTGNDRLANFVQFFAMVGCVIGVSLIAQKMGGTVYAQIFSSVAVATLPMGILQSTSTQTDYVAALWLVSLVSLILQQLQARRLSIVLDFLMGMSLGLAVLTKITILLFGVSFGIWFVLYVYRHFKAGMVKNIVIVLGVFLIIITPHSLRNYMLYGNPLGPLAEAGIGGYKYTNDMFGFRVLTSNLIRNASLHLAAPWGGVNEILERNIVYIHEYVGISVNFPGSTWKGTKFIIDFSNHEDRAGNPIHFLLFGLSVISLLFSKEHRIKIYVISVFIGFVIFSWLLKWQPWHGRLQLPFFVLAMPVIGLALSKRLHLELSYVVLFFLCLAAMQYLFQNPSRLLFGKHNIFTQKRVQQYFANRPDYYQAYENQVEVINNLQCNNVGLMTGIDDWEYPIWVMTKANGKNDIHFEHILVENVSGKLANDFAPCAILSTYPLQEEVITYQGREFVKAYDEKPLSLFVLTDVQR